MLPAVIAFLQLKPREAIFSKSIKHRIEKASIERSNSREAKPHTKQEPCSVNIASCHKCHRKGPPLIYFLVPESYCKKAGQRGLHRDSRAKRHITHRTHGAHENSQGNTKWLLITLQTHTHAYTHLGGAHTSSSTQHGRRRLRTTKQT